MMRRLLISTAAAALALTSFAASPAAAQRGGQDKFAVCHFAGNMRDADGPRTGRILLLPGRAALSHLRHGDAPAGIAPVMGSELRGKECTATGGVVTVPGDDGQPVVVFGPEQIAALIRLVQESDLSQREKDLLIELINEFFS